METLGEHSNVLIQGASRGIGAEITAQLLERHDVGRLFATSRKPHQSSRLDKLADEHGFRLERVSMDIASEDSIQKAAAEIARDVDALDLIFNVTGILHDSETGLSPEKSLRDLDPSNLNQSFRVNAFGPILVAKHFYPLVDNPDRAVIANMSARIGSIGDNHIGGWYGYRASKAAQNQFTRTLSIEIDRRSANAICVALHPGTVDTQLSRPYHSSVPEEQIFSTETSAKKLLTVIDNLEPDDSGQFFDYAGEPIQW
jgi:NAD(P)-dependent dehydrogenase (short-subunit alcohol dehydrogenase family)